MADISKIDMTKLWGDSGDKIQPSDLQISTGWLVQQVPRQTWNWLENRQDQNIAYLFQKGIPEWDSTTEYRAGKSYVQRANTVYKCVVTNTGTDPTTVQTSWVKAFVDSTAYLEAIKGLLVTNSTMPSINASGVATNVPFGTTGLASLAATTAAQGRTAIDAQQANVNLTSLSGITAATNALPYFTGTTSASTTPLTSYARTLLDDTDAVAARATLEVSSAVDTAQALSDGLATKQPLSSLLTAIAATTVANNTMSYWTSTNTAATTALTAFARSLLDDADAAAARSTLEVDSAATVASNLAAGLATKQPLHSNLSALAGTTPSTNTMFYWTSPTTVALATVTPFARTVMDDIDAATMRATIGANDASNLTAGTLSLARLPADLTGINAATATKLATARTIQGVAFDGTANITLSVVDKDSAFGAAGIPAGSTAQRPANGAGKLRFNTDTSRAEINNGTAWGSLGGASGGGDDSVFYLNGQNVTANFTVPTGQNAMSAGPITIANGVTVTVSNGSVWTIV